MLYNYFSIVCGVDLMETIIILITITLVFSITIGLIIVNRDDVPDVLVEEYNENLKEKRREIKANDEINKDIIDNDIEVTISNDDEII